MGPRQPTMKMAHAPFWESRQELRMHRMHPELRLCDHHDARRCLSHPLPTSDSPTSSSPSTYPKLMQLSLLQWRIKNWRVIPSPDAAIIVYCSHSYSVLPPTAASPSLFSTQAWQRWGPICHSQTLTSDDLSVSHFDGNKTIQHATAILDNYTTLCPACPWDFFSKNLLY